MTIDPLFQCPYCATQTYSRKFMRMHISTFHTDAPIPPQFEDALPSLAVLAFARLVAAAQQRAREEGTA